MAIPIETPGKIIAIGANYHDHIKEVGATAPEIPLVFGLWANSLIGPGDPIILIDPEVDNQIDYEGELGVVIGTSARGVSRENALEVVRGYCCFNDVSARGIQNASAPAWPNLALAKSPDTFCPVGALTPAAEVDPENLRLRTILNGEVVQDGNTSNMIFSVAEIISLLTQTITLEPGDLIATGTPAGVGVARKPPLFLKDGDEITIEIEGLAPLTNPVRAA